MRWTASAPTAFAEKSGTQLLLGSILVLGAWTRLSGLDLGWFLQDQARDGTVALGIVSGRDFPLVGPEAGGTFRLGPLFYYLLAIPYGLSADPKVGVAFQTLLALLSIYLAYRLGEDLFGPPVGLVGAALYAAFPAAVLSGKTLWNPGFIPVCTTLFLIALWHWLTGPRPWLLALLLPLLGAILQIHASLIICVVLFLAALLLYRPVLSPRALLMGLLGLALLYAPRLLFEVQHGFPDLRNLVGWAQNARPIYPTSPFWPTAWRGLATPFLLPERLAAALSQEALPDVFPVIERAELVLLGLGLLALAVRLIKATDRRAYLLLVLWFILPFMIFPRLKVAAMPWYYFDVLYPAPFLVIGLLAQPWLDVWPRPGSTWRPQRWRRTAMYVLVCTIVVVQIWFAMCLDAAAKRSGVLRITEDVVLNYRPPDWKWIGEAIPLRFEVALAEQFRSEFGVDHAALEKTAHGAVYQQFREDRGFSFLIASPRTMPGPFDPSLHYVLLRSKGAVALEQGREVRSGPYRILAYRPAIRYESWQWSVNPGPEWWREAFGDSPWKPLNLPVREVNCCVFAQWPATTVSFRGWLEVPSLEHRLWLILNIRSHLVFPHRVAALYLNGRPLELVRTVAYDTFTAHNIEVSADVTSALRVGTNLVAFQITGQTEHFDLDVYELRLASDLEEEER
jgi:hypothetical protein